MAGLPEFTAGVQALVFGVGHPIIAERRATTVQAPGGTAALRVAGDFIHKASPNSTVWVSQPTWPNHPPLFRNAGLSVDTYPYFDAQNNCVDLDAMMGGLERR